MVTSSPETAATTASGGGSGSDQLIGRGGNDKLNGGNGNDRLMGGGGGDQLNGGDGVDRAEYSGAAKKIRADLQASAKNTGEAKGDTYTSVEDLVGSGYGDILAGNGGANSLWGGDGNDRLVGRGGKDNLVGGNGNDTLRGDKGSDTYTGGAGDDVFIFNKHSGSDTVLDFGDNDVIRILSGANRMSDLAFTDTVDGLLLEFSTADIFFDGLDRSDLNAGDFDFV